VLQTELSLEKRVAKIEAERDINRLKMQYARACDEQYDPEQLAPMFAEDAVWDGGPTFGAHVGRAAISDYFAGISGTISWAMHYIVGGDITVNDDLETATANWQLWCPVSMKVDGEWTAVVLASTYADQYVREADGWKFARMDVHFTLQAAMAEGWGERQFHL
jgi:hypothetical protein